jgi:MoaA/NifB/PqqE/SkfB family radical SAM enzyme
MLTLKQIRRVHVELTTRCNARCPMCPRNYRGSDYNGGYPLTELDLDRFKKIFTPDFLKQLGPEDSKGFEKFRRYQRFGVSFNGNLGDFAAARDSVEIVEYLVEHGIEVTVCTNGGLRTPAWWRRLALPGVEIGFALDGLADTHHLYRQDTVWQRVIDNAKSFIDAGGTAVWRFIPFDHNRHQETACRELADSMGFARFENIYDGRDRGPVFDRNGEFSHYIGDRWPSESQEPQDIKPLLESHVTWFNFNTIKHEKDVPGIEINCIHKRNEEIYIAADGSVYPCCFLGFYPGTMQHPGNEQLLPLVQENNALEYELSHCVEWFAAVEESWRKESIKQGRLYQCVSTCGKLPGTTA